MQTFSYIKELKQKIINKYSKNETPKIIMIDGGVGVGKTTLIRGLKNVFRKEDGIRVDEEYYEGHSMGSTKLSQYLNNQISQYDFQLFILNYWESTLNWNKQFRPYLMIFERTPIACEAFMNNNMSLIEKSEVIYRASQLMKENDMDKITYVEISEENNNLINVLETILETDGNILIFLSPSFKTQWKRYISRGRLEENYSEPQMLNFNNSLRNIYLNNSTGIFREKIN